MTEPEAPTRSARWPWMVALGLLLAGIVWYGALEQVGTASNPPQMIPPVSSTDSPPITTPEFSSERFQATSPDESENGSRADQPTPTPEPRLSQAALRVDSPVEAEPGLGSPPTTAPQLDYAAGPGSTTVSDATFRTAIDGWRAPEQCAAELRVRTSGAIKVELTFDSSGQATELRPIVAQRLVAKRYVRCLEDSLASLEIPRAPGEAVSREATFVF